VESFIFSNLLLSIVKSSKYSGLFHVSDWFPTILDIAGLSYNPEMGHELDGYDYMHVYAYVYKRIKTYMYIHTHTYVYIYI
jgi:arylsulfatase A-like enzyme